MKKEIATICCLVGMAVIQLITASVSTEPDNIIALSSLPSLCNGGPNSSDITAGCLAEEDDEELMMDSEVHRRLILEADGKSIDNHVLFADRPLCNPGKYSYICCVAAASNPRPPCCNSIHGCAGIKG